MEYEIWKDIKGFEGRYKVSNFGNIMTFFRGEWKPKAPFITNNGYMYVTLYYRNKYKKISVHRLVAETFVDGWFEGAEVNHKDLEKTNNKWDNLEWCTHKDNIVHQIIKYNRQAKQKYCAICGNKISRDSRGLCLTCYKKQHTEKAHNAWPSYDTLFELLKTDNYTQIGKKYNMSDNNIRKICKRYNLPANKQELIQFRKDNNCYIPPKSSSRKSKEERYTHYEVNGIKNTAHGWSLFLGLEEKRIGRYANKHTYDETIEYIKSFMD